MKTIQFPKDFSKFLKLKSIPTDKIGFYKPHNIYHILDYKHRPTHTYIRITKILPLLSPPKGFPKGAKMELLCFKIVYEDEFLDPNGNPIVFNFKY